MPMTAKGKKIMNAMQEAYGKSHGEEVYHASENAGKIKGTHKPKGKKKMPSKDMHMMPGQKMPMKDSEMKSMMSDMKAKKKRR